MENFNSLNLQSRMVINLHNFSIKIQNTFFTHFLPALEWLQEQLVWHWY